MDFLNSDEGRILLARLRKGDVNAFEEVYQKCNGPLYLFVFRYIKSKQEAEEIVQDVFIQLWMKKENIRENLSFKSFLFTITKNKIIDYFRRKKTKDLYLNYLRNYTEIISTTTDQDFIYKDFDSLIAQIVNKLPEKRKMVFIMNKKLGMTRAEIADFFQVSENTVKNQLQEAMDFIRQNIRKEVFTLLFFLFVWLD